MCISQSVKTQSSFAALKACFDEKIYLAELSGLIGLKQKRIFNVEKQGLIEMTL